jgi:hypothetical protein
MQKLNDLSRSLTALEPDGTLIAVIEMSLSSWLVAGIVPGVERQPSKKLAADESALLSPSRPAVTASGWRAGSRRAATLLRNAAGPYIGATCDHSARQQSNRSPSFVIIVRCTAGFGQ